MNTGDLRVYGDLQAGVWQRIYSSGELAASASSITISSLDGDTDKVWKLVIKRVADVGGGSTFIKLNGNGLNYGSQWLTGENASIGAYRETAGIVLYLTYQAAVINDSALGEMIIYAKSGTNRTVINCECDSIRTTSVNYLALMGQTWMETSANITSMILTSTSFGSTSSIDLYRRIDAS